MRRRKPQGRVHTSDGRQLLQDYRDLGLDVQLAVNAVESGIFEVWQLLSGVEWTPILRQPVNP